MSTTIPSVMNDSERLQLIALLDQDRERNVELVYKIIMAAEQDHKGNKLSLGRWSRSKYERQLNDSYPNMQNSTPFHTAVRYHRIMTGNIKGTASTIKGSDVFNIARFFFVNLAGYGWPSVEKVISSEGEPYKKLLRLKGSEPMPPEDRYRILSNQRVGDIVGPSADPGGALRELADQYDQLNTELRLSNTKAKMLMEEKVKIRQGVRNAELALNRLTRAMEKEKDPDKSELLKQELAKISKMLKDLRRFV